MIGAGHPGTQRAGEEDRAQERDAKEMSEPRACGDHLKVVR